MAVGSNEVLKKFAYMVGVEVDDEPLENLSEGLARIGQGVGGLIQQFKQVGAAALAAVSASAGAVVALADATSRAGLDARDLAAGLGVTTEFAQQMAFAFGTIGLEVDDLSDAFNTLNDRAQDAAAGGGEAAESFALLGLDAQRLISLDPAQFFAEFADGVANTTDVGRRNAAIVRILGDDLGRKLLPLLLRGSRGFKDLAAEADQLGVVLDKDTIKASVEFREQVARLDGAMKGLRNEVGSAFLPVLSSLTEDLLSWIKRNRELIRSRVDLWVGRITDALLLLDNVIKRVDTAVERRLGSWEPVILGVAAAVAALVAAFVASGFVAPLIAIGSGLTIIAGTAVGAAAGFGALIAVIVGAGLLQILLQVGAAVAFAALAFEDLNTWLEGGESLFGALLAKLREFGPVGEAFAEYLAEVVRLGDELSETLWLLMRGAWAAFKSGVADVRDNVVNLWNALTDLFELIEGNTGIFSDLLGNTADFLGGVRSFVSLGNEGLRGVVEDQEQFADRRLAGTARSLDPGTRALADARGNGASGPVNVTVNYSGPNAPGEMGREAGRGVQAAVAGGGVP